VEINVWTVFIAAFITALMTGVGALPFLFIRGISINFLKISNAIAGGLMLAASHALVVEGAVYSNLRVIIGLIIGLISILLSKGLITKSGDIKIAELAGADAAKAFLILGVMLAHSFAEGIGVGVSFGAKDESLGVFITTAIAVHNIPEGLAISLILIPRGIGVWNAALWSIFTSLPQPLMAVLAYLFVEIFEQFLPIGLGIAAGAMIWMVFAELIPESLGVKEDYTIGLAVTAAFIVMLAFQFLISQRGVL